MKSSILQMILLILSVLSTIPCSGIEYTNYICPGTQWEVEEYYPAYPPMPAQTLNITYTVADTIIDNKNCLSLIRNGEKDGMSLYLEEDKVWILPENNTEWELLYDYGLQSGQQCTVSINGWGWFSNIAYNSQGNFTEYPDIPYIEVYNEDSEKRYDTDSHLFKWIPGIGSTKGLNRNSNVIFSGGGSSKLLKVVRDNETVYEADYNQDTGVNMTCIHSKADSSIYDLTGRKINSIESKGIYIINGKKVAIN